MKELILDKSYLDAATPEQIGNLCSEYRVLMPDVLLYELTTTKDKSMRNCFNKFPNTTNPVDLIPNIGKLLCYELITRGPCTPLYDRKEKIVFNFNNSLRSGIFEFTESQKERNNIRETIVKNETKEFFELAMMVSTFFPQINGIPYADLPSQIQAAKTRVATDIPTVRKIYEQLSETGIIHNPLPSDTINPNWGIFRWVQVRCLYSLDLIFRHQGHLPPNPAARFWAKIEHDMLDSQYLILASLSDAIACNDNRMTEFFHLIRPSSLLLTCMK